jgi:signal peptidase I
MRTGVLTFIVLFVTLNISCVKPIVLEGSSMAPAYNEGDRIMIRTDVGDPKRGDVIWHLYPNNIKQTYIKRIIGLPNETIEIKNGVVFIDEKPLDEPYLDATTNQSKQTIPLRKIEPNAYFVIGDNRDNSSDSRIWGTVQKELVKGVVWFKYADGSKK